ncbi:MAG: hypothetical protein R3C14_22495 [Caldilineaceae bacterium]
MDKHALILPFNSFKKFLITGSLGNLTAYPSREEVERQLGKPITVDEKVGIIPNQILYILHYSNLQITYIDSSFFQLAIYFREYAQVQTLNELPHGLGVDWYMSVKELDYHSFQSYLLSENITCRQVIFPYPNAEDGFTLEITSTGIWTCFTDAPNYAIDSIFYTPSRPGVWQYEELSI